MQHTNSSKSIWPDPYFMNMSISNVTTWFKEPFDIYFFAKQNKKIIKK